jgi:hypothetical protein
MTTPCATWIALSDREALGEPLDRDERAFLTQHRLRCAACASEHATWCDLAGVLDAEVSASEPATRMVERPRASARKRLALFAFSAAALALLSLSLHRAELPLASAPRTRTKTSSGAEMQRTAVLARLSSARAGEVELDGKPAEAGAVLHVGSVVFARSGAACLTVEPGVRACLTAGSLLRVAELSHVQRRLELLVGKVVSSLSPQPEGTSFGIVTRAGSAIAIGTAFSVEVPANTGAIVTRVMHGVVLVRGSAGVERRVGAHRMAAMNGEPHALSTAEEARELRVVEEGQLAQPVPVAPEASTLVDAHAGEHEPAPLRHVPANAPSVVAKAEPGLGPLGARASQPRFDPSATRTSADARSDPAAEARAPAQLLLQARELRESGDVEAAQARYRELLARHRETPEAQTARVPYGEILLSRGAAREALGSFEEYLARGGSLREEASFGRVRALRALGELAGEQAALTEFLRTYPESPLGDALRAREHALDATGSRRVGVSAEH